MLRKFNSIARPNEFGFSYDTDCYGSSTVSDRFRMFQTYGDGLIQHSSDFAITWAYAPDYLAALATAMLTDEELVSHVAFTLDKGRMTQEFEFAAGVVFKETDREYGKGRFYSMEERKVSSSQAKRHDKRYFEIAPWMDGSPDAIYRMVLPEWADGIHRYVIAESLRDWVLAQDSKRGLYMPLAATFLKLENGDRDYAQSMRSAYNACLLLIRAYQMRTEAESHLGNVTRSMERKRTEQAA